MRPLVAVLRYHSAAIASVRNWEVNRVLDFRVCSAARCEGRPRLLRARYGAIPQRFFRNLPQEMRRQGWHSVTYQLHLRRIYRDIATPNLLVDDPSV